MPGLDMPPGTRAHSALLFAAREQAAGFQALAGVKAWILLQVIRR